MTANCEHQSNCCVWPACDVTPSLKQQNKKVFGIDNINDYYNTKIKYSNLKILKKYKDFTFYKENIVTTKIINKIATK